MNTVRMTPTEASASAIQVMEERREWWARRSATIEKMARFLNVSKTALAERSGMTRQTLVGRLTGQTKLEPWELPQIAVGLGVPEEVLWKDPDDAVRWVLDHPDQVKIGNRWLGAGPGPGGGGADIVRQAPSGRSEMVRKPHGRRPVARRKVAAQAAA